MVDLFKPWVSAGFTRQLLPVKWGEKAPAISNWVTHDATDADCRTWGVSGHNVGLQTKHFPVIDIDVDDPDLAQRVGRLAFRLLGDTLTRNRPRTGKHILLYRRDGTPFKKRILRMFKEDPFGNVDEVVVEILADGQQVVLDGLHPNGDVFFWPRGRPLDVAALPPLAEEKADRFLLTLQQKLHQEGWTTSRSTTIGAAAGHTSPLGTQAQDPDVIKDAMSHIPNNDAHYDEWLRIGMALKAALGDDGFDLWYNWSFKSAKHELSKNTAETWDSLEPHGDIGAGTIIHIARQNGWKPPTGYGEKLHPKKRPQEDFQVYEPGAKELEHIENKTKNIPGFAVPDVPTLWPTIDTDRIPPQEWVVEGWVPKGHVTSLYGPGGTGKTLLAQQLGMHVAAGKPFLGLRVPAKLNVLCFFCEDDMLTLKRRLQAQMQAAFLKPKHLHKLRFHSACGEDSVLMEFSTGDAGRGTITDVFKRLEQTIKDNHIDLLILDALANVFAGNENNRSHVQQFVQRVLQKLAANGTTVLMLAHPSKSAMATGNGGYSGSTAWENAVRSRLDFIYEDSDPNHGGPPLRTLTKAKSNYSIMGEKIVVEWHDWSFRKLYSVGDAAREQDMDNAFLDGLRYANQSQIILQPTNRGTGEYAAAWIKKHHPAAGRYRVEDLQETQDRLLSKGVIRQDVVGHYANRSPKRGLVIVETDPFS